MWFSLSRFEGFPTQYGPNQTPVTFDVVEVGIITSFAIVGIAFLVSLPRPKLSTNINLFIRVYTSLLIGLFLLLSNFGQEWEVGQVKSRMPYKAGSVEQINASVGVKIGLRSVNVTLLRQDNFTVFQKETINYNERFEWTWDQGRLGFGPFAGLLQQEFRAAQYRGLPTPILWVVDCFVIDGEGFRFGRFYRTAGWYCHIALWTAFACWIIANVLLRCVVHYGAYYLAFCGLLQLTANLVWITVRNPIPLEIAFEHGVITTKFGFSFWICFVNGLVCITLAVIILVMHTFWFNQLYKMFGLDPLNGYDHLIYLTPEEMSQLRPKNRNDGMGIPLVEMQQHEQDDDMEYQPVYIKRKTILTPGPKVIRSNKPLNYMPSQ